MKIESDHPLLHEYVRLFNAGDFYAAHEKMEELWILHGRREGEASRVYQGLVQLAAALLHWTRKNEYGAGRLLRRAEKNLADVDLVGWNMECVMRGARVRIVERRGTALPLWKRG